MEDKKELTADELRDYIKWMQEEEYLDAGFMDYELREVRRAYNNGEYIESKKTKEDDND